MCVNNKMQNTENFQEQAFPFLFYKTDRQQNKK